MYFTAVVLGALFFIIDEKFTYIYLVLFNIFSIVCMFFVWIYGRKLAELFININQISFSNNYLDQPINNKKFTKLLISLIVLHFIHNISMTVITYLEFKYPEKV